jgi:outer membrane protein assembly factor BamD (BamD/ComL family)
MLGASAFSPEVLAEMQILRGARTALSQGRADDALKELKTYEQKFPGGQRTDDVTLLRIEAHLKKGDRKTATQLAEGLKAKAPESRQNMRAQRLLSAPPPPAP